MPDSVRLRAAHKLVRKVYWNGNLDSSLYYAEQQYTLAIQTGWDTWQARSLEDQGFLHYRRGDFQTAYALFQRAIVIQKQQGDWKRLAELYRLTGFTLRKTGKIPESMTAYQQGLSMAKKMGEMGVGVRASILNSMGSLYLNQEDFPAAQKHYEESLRLHHELGKQAGIAANVNNLSKVFTATGQYDLAREFLQQSLRIKRERNDLEGIANSSKNLGDIFLKQGRADSARHFYAVAQVLQDSLGLRADEASIFGDLGAVALFEKKWATALELCHKGLAQATAAGDLKVQVKNGECLYRTYRELGDAEAALVQLEATAVLRDSFLSAANTRELKAVELDYLREKAALETILHQDHGWLTKRSFLVVLLILIGLGTFLWLRKKPSQPDAPTTTLPLEKTTATPSLSGANTTVALPNLEAAPVHSPTDAAWLQQITQLFRAEVANPDFTMEDAARTLFISRSNLQRRIKKITGQTPNKYFREIKLQIAKELLEAGALETVGEVATAVGFDTPHYFSTIFEQRFGGKPSEWLRPEGR